MKLVTPFFLGLLHMSGCSIGTPPAREVTAIERLTSKSTCVGRLDRWHRLFSFDKRGGWIDRNLISVTYVQAGHDGLPAGRTVAEPERSFVIDDAQFRVAGGTYDRTARRFVRWSCGCNWPPYDVDHQVECRKTGS